MKLENNWQQKTIENLEKNIWPQSNQHSHLINTCSLLRKKPIQNFTIEDLRIMIGQEIGLDYLIPFAIEKLSIDLFAEGDMYEGDLLKSVLNIDTDFWKSNKIYWQQINELISPRREEL